MASAVYSSTAILLYQALEVVEGFEQAIQTVVTKPSDPNVPDLNSAVYMDASIILALNEFSICVWYKPAQLEEQVIIMLAG